MPSLLKSFSAAQLTGTGEAQTENGQPGRHRGWEATPGLAESQAPAAPPPQLPIATEPGLVAATSNHVCLPYLQPRTPAPRRHNQMQMHYVWAQPTAVHLGSLADINHRKL